MRAIFRYWQAARAATAPVETAAPTREERVAAADGAREHSQRRDDGGRDRCVYSTDPGFEAICREYEAFQRLALDAPRASRVAAAESAKRKALLDDLFLNDDTYKSFAHFKAWRAELGLRLPGHLQD
jgi:hypothetical protein